MPVCRLLYRQLGRQFDSPDTVSLLARLTNWFTLKARAAQTELGYGSSVCKVRFGQDTIVAYFFKQLVNDDLRARQLFRLYYDRGEISEEQFFSAIETYKNNVN